MNYDELRPLWSRLAEGGSDPTWIVVRPEVIAKLRRIEEQAQHWYWRAWWRVRYALPDLRDWLRERRGEEA